MVVLQQEQSLMFDKLSLLDLIRECTCWLGQNVLTVKHSKALKSRVLIKNRKRKLKTQTYLNSLLTYRYIKSQNLKNHGNLECFLLTPWGFEMWKYLFHKQLPKFPGATCACSKHWPKNFKSFSLLWFCLYRLFRL